MKECQILGYAFYWKVWNNIQSLVVKSKEDWVFRSCVKAKLIHAELFYSDLFISEDVFINIYLHLGFLSFLSIWTLLVLIWYGLHCCYKEGNCAVYGLIPGWSGRKVFWLLSKIQTFYTCDSQILPDLYSGI